MMAPQGFIALARECEAIQIPAGAPTRLPKGALVQITQTLGGTYTVMAEWGELLRIDGRDADAMGLAVEAAPGATTAAGGEAGVEERVWDQLRTVYDPEIPANIVDLGLVYECKISPLPEGASRVEVTMSLTAPGCGMGDVLRADAEKKILALAGVKEANVQVVLDPPWDPSRMSEAARLQLGMD